jgi:hypothetical protein
MVIPSNVASGQVCLLKGAEILKLVLPDKAVHLCSIRDELIVVTKSKLYRGKFELGLREEIKMKSYFFEFETYMGIEEASPTGSCLSLLFIVRSLDDRPIEGKHDSKVAFGESKVYSHSKNLSIEAKIQWFKLSKPVSMLHSSKGLPQEMLKSPQDSVNHFRKKSIGSETPLDISLNAKSRSQQRTKTLTQVHAPHDNSSRIAALFSGEPNKGQKQLTESQPFVTIAKVEDFQNKLKEELKKIELRHQGKLSGVGKGVPNESFHDTNSSITIASSQIRKKIDTMLGEWSDQGASKQAPKQSKYEAIRQLIDGVTCSTTASRLPTDRHFPSANQQPPVLQPSQIPEQIDKKAKLALIKANLNKIETRPMDLVSNKETIEYEFSDGEFSDPDQGDAKFKGLDDDKDINFNKGRYNHMIEEVQEESERLASMVCPSKQNSHLEAENVEADLNTQNIIQDEVFDYQVNEVEFEDTEGSRDRRGAHRNCEPDSPPGHSMEEMRLFAQVIDQKITLILRIKRRNAWRLLLDRLEQLYVASIEAEKTEQCQEILIMLALELRRKAGWELLDITKGIQHLVRVENFGYFIQEKIENSEKRSAFEQLLEAAEEDEGTLLDPIAVRKVLIIAKTIIHQKRYLLFHKVFGQIKKMSEDKKLRTRRLASSLGAIEKKFNRWLLASSFGRLQLQSKLTAMVNAFERQCKATCLGKFYQFKQDRSFLACTESDITLVRDDSMEISKSRFEKKFHLNQYLGTLASHGRASEDEKAFGFQRNKRQLHQNTLEDIRNELSHMHGRRLEDYSGFSKKSDQSKGKPGATSTETKGRSKSPMSEDKHSKINKVFSNDKLVKLVANGGIPEPGDRQAALSQADPSSISHRPRSTGLQEKLIEIQLIDDNPKEDLPRQTSPDARDLPPLDRFRKQFKTEEAPGSRYDIDEEENFNFDIRPTDSEMKENPHIHTFGPPKVSPKSDMDAPQARPIRHSPTDNPDEAEVDLGSREKQGKSQENKEYLSINGGLERDGSLPNLIQNIKSNFSELQKIYQLAATQPDDQPAQTKVTEPSSEDTGNVDKKFQAGFNFISGQETANSKHTVKKAIGQKSEYLKKDLQVSSSPKAVDKKSNMSRDDSRTRGGKDSSLRPKLENSELVSPHDNPDELHEPSSNGQLPLGFTKTQLSFRSFFKKLEKGHNDKSSKPVSASMVADKGNESLLKLISPMKQPPANEYSFKTASKSHEKDAKKSAGSLSKLVRLTKDVPVPSPALPKKSNSLIERVQNHIRSPPDSTKKDLRRQASREGSQTSAKTPYSVQKPAARKALSTKHLQSESKELFKSTLSSKKNVVPATSDRKPPIKIKDNSRSHLEISSGIKKHKSERSPNRPPLIPKQIQKQQLASSQLSNQSIDNLGLKKSSARLNTSIKSNRTTSAKSDSSRRLDNSNEGYKQRYQEVRGQLKSSSNYVKIADARKQYRTREESPYS